MEVRKFLRGHREDIQGGETEYTGIKGEKGGTEQEGLN